MSDDESTGVLRSTFHTSDVDEVEQFIAETYADMSVQVPEDRARFVYHHETVATTAMVVSSLHTPMSWAGDVEPVPGQFIAVGVNSGHLSYDGRDHGEVSAEPGGCLLFPPTGGARMLSDHADVDVLSLDARAVAGYARHVTGVESDGVRWQGLFPLTPALGRYWRSIVARLRENVLADPVLATSPIILGNEFRTAAAALLATFPNTALERLTDPESRPPRGNVPEPTLRAVSDFLHSDADRSIGPAEIAEVAGMPAREIVEGLRRRHDVHPAHLLWQARLTGVRRDLVDADPESGPTVRETAARWGFARGEAFRTAYLRQFGESPEDTRRG